MTYSEKHKRLIKYLKMKVADRDWHAVSDAANDLRVLETQEWAKAFYAPIPAKETKTYES